MTFQFVPASKKQAKARVALIGPSGSGKTWTGLTLAGGLGERIALIDTESRSSEKYADRFQFHVLPLTTFAPATYVQAIHAAEEQGFDVLMIDSLSHAWAGKGGALEMVDAAAARTKDNKFAAWRHVTPEHTKLIDALIGCRCHLIATMRSRTEWVVEDVNGKKVPRKVGLAPIQRDGMEYEFDIVADMDLDNRLIVSKSRCPGLSGAVVEKPTVALAQEIRAWLEDGEATEDTTMLMAELSLECSRVWGKEQAKEQRLANLSQIASVLTGHARIYRQARQIEPGDARLLLDRLKEMASLEERNQGVVE